MKWNLNRATSYTSAFAISGLIIVLLIIYVQQNILDTFQRNLPYISLGDNIKNRSTKGHLWFEELMAGDESLDFDKDVMVLFNSSADILKGAYNAQETELGTFEKLDDKTTYLILKEAIGDIEALTESAKVRYDFMRKNSGDNETGEAAGGKLDQEFDEAYEEFQETMDRMVNHLNEQVQKDSAFLEKLSWVSVVLVIIAFVVLCIVMYKLQTGNDTMVLENQVKLEEEGTRMTAVSHFIEGVSSGNYVIDLQNLKADDPFAQTLITMRDKLARNAENDRKQNWATNGVADLGDILRGNYDSASDLYDQIIKFVVKYTNSSTGGLFIFEEETQQGPHLALAACYAYDRKKFLEKRIEVGEGLLGQCFLEGERIYLLKVPNDYMAITSGMGGTNPSAILMVPMKVNDKIFGVVELSSLNSYEEHEMLFVEKVAENIASSISSVRVNERTRILLEKTQQQAEEMRAQEEEVRQNMEELEATQEEMRRKEKHLQEILAEEQARNEANKQGRELIAKLTKNRDIQLGNWSDALELVTQSISKQIGASRVSIWLYNDHERKITCSKLYAARTREYSEGTQLFERDFPAYFRAVLSDEVIVASDARQHPSTKDFTEVYFKPLNIFSLLDVPFYNNTKITGVICCEHEDEIFNWKDEHIEFCVSCSSLLTIALKGWELSK